MHRAFWATARPVRCTSGRDLELPPVGQQGRRARLKDSNDKSREGATIPPTQPFDQGWWPCPNSVPTNGKPSVAAVWLVLGKRARRNVVAKPEWGYALDIGELDETEEQIAHQAGVCRKAVRSALRLLEQTGHIERRRVTVSNPASKARSRFITSLVGVKDWRKNIAASGPSKARAKGSAKGTSTGSSKVGQQDPQGNSPQQRNSGNSATGMKKVNRETAKKPLASPAAKSAPPLPLRRPMTSFADSEDDGTLPVLAQGDRQRNAQVQREAAQADWLTLRELTPAEMAPGGRARSVFLKLPQEDRAQAIEAMTIFAPIYKSSSKQKFLGQLLSWLEDEKFKLDDSVWRKQAEVAAPSAGGDQQAKLTRADFRKRVQRL